MDLITGVLSLVGMSLGGLIVAILVAGVLAVGFFMIVLRT